MATLVVDTSGATGSTVTVPFNLDGNATGWIDEATGLPTFPGPSDTLNFDISNGVDTYVLDVTTDAFLSAGETVNIAAGVTVRFSGENLLVVGSPAFSGPGTLIFDGNVNFLSLTGDLDLPLSVILNGDFIGSNALNITTELTINASLQMTYLDLESPSALVTVNGETVTQVRMLDGHFHITGFGTHGSLIDAQAGGRLSVENDGRILSDVTGGAGDDIVWGDGIFEDTIALGGGQDHLTIGGIAESTIVMEAGDDLLTVHGFTQDTVDLGSGADTLTNTGTILGDVIGGTEADTVINSGVMFNTDTGTGDDIVHNSGTINLLSTDAGSDTVTNDDGILTAFNLGTEDDTLIMAGGLANGTGGAGADSFVFTVGGANLTVFDYEDADIIEIDGALGAGYSVNVLNPDGSSNGIGLADNSIGNGNSQVLDLLIETFSWGARITFEQSATGFSLTQAPTTTITLYGDDATDFSLSDLVFV